MEDGRENLNPDERMIGESVPAGADERINGELDADDFPMTKHWNPTPIPDRLSELPDLAIVHILSRLYFHEAVKTSVLSKRFSSLWNSVTGLNFSDEFSGKNLPRFLSFVDRALSLHRGREIEKFSVSCLYNLGHAGVVDSWIQFATEKQVKLLDLNFRSHPKAHEHELPQLLYSNEGLTELVVNCCKFIVVNKISWNSLKLLSIGGTKLNEELISRVLSGCPVLETLELRDWSGFDRVKVKSVSLRVLRIIGEQRPKYLISPEDDCLLEISGPNLVSLEISGRLYRTRARLVDVGSLLSAKMDFDTMQEGPKSKKSRFLVRNEDIAREVLESLCFVKKLTVGGWFIKVLSRFQAYSISSPWSERKSLTLYIPVQKWDHLGISNLLHSSPCLETLVIRLSCCSQTGGIGHSHDIYNNHKEEYFWTSWGTISSCPLKHLKTVKVVGFCAFCGAGKVFLFLQFLLRNSSVLEELVIEASQFVTGEALNEAMKLLSLRTASPDFVARFEPPHFWVNPLCIYQR